jgi:hypothetical protein
MTIADYSDLPMPSMLHVVNGDATASRLEPAALPGDVLVWRDILVEGPVAGGLEIDALAAWRAPWLARRLGIAEDAYVAAGAAQAAGLARVCRYDEVVLWFEQDLFCAANLGFLAAWLERARPAAHIRLIFPESALGTSESTTLAGLFAHRRRFDHAAVAATWWRGFCAPDPREFAAIPPSAPFFERARTLHLARLPDIATGLGAVEAAVLHALGAGPQSFASLFRGMTNDARMRGLGMGDVQLAAHIAALDAGPTPLVTIEGEPGLTEATFRTWRVGITEAGQAVRRGAVDRLDAQPLDWWVGGVHLEGHDSPWRWDAAAGEVRAR